MALIEGFDHVAITVADLEQSCRFYADLFGGRLIRDVVVDGRVVVRQIQIGGGAMLSIHQANNGADLLAADKPAIGSADFCMRWSGSIATAVSLLNSKGIRIVKGPVPRNNAFGEDRVSVYFRDPDRNLVELMSTA